MSITFLLYPFYKLTPAAYLRQYFHLTTYLYEQQLTLCEKQKLLNISFHKYIW